MTFGELPKHNEQDVGDYHLTQAQSTFLYDFNRKANKHTVNRPFNLLGRLPRRRLARKGIVINADLSDEDLLGLARAGYLDYNSQQRTVTFRGKAYDPSIQTPVMCRDYSKINEIRFWRFELTFGKYLPITVVRLLFTTAAIILVILYSAGYVSSSAAQTWATIVGLIVATVALGFPQRGDK